MARRKKQTKQEEDTLIDVVGGVNNAQDYFERNRNTILGIAVGFALLVGAFVVYKYMYLDPRKAEASTALAEAQEKFESAAYTEALDAPGNGGKGFLDIIDEYSGTPAANTAQFYAGLSYLHLGKFEAAIEYLSDYKAKDDVTPAFKFGALGDAHSELGNSAEAIANYKKAASTKGNDFTTPFYLLRLASFQEKNGNSDDAVAAYERITKEFPKSPQFVEAEKSLIRLKG